MSVAAIWCARDKARSKSARPKYFKCVFKTGAINRAEAVPKNDDLSESHANSSDGDDLLSDLR
jgi:hypothetical protein